MVLSSLSSSTAGEERIVGGSRVEHEGCQHVGGEPSCVPVSGAQQVDVAAVWGTFDLGGPLGGFCKLNRTGFPGDSISWEIMESWED